MINFGIIGAGRLGTTHANNLAMIDGVKLAAVYDICDEKAKIMPIETIGGKGMKMRHENKMHAITSN